MCHQASEARRMEVVADLAEQEKSTHSWIVQSTLQSSIFCFQGVVYNTGIAHMLIM